jgi:hypothetical protein
MIKCGYLRLSSTGAEHLFEVFSQRYEHDSNLRSRSGKAEAAVG